MEPAHPDAFEEFRVRRECRLVEITPAALGEETAALAFALAWGRSAASSAGASPPPCGEAKTAQRFWVGANVLNEEKFSLRDSNPHPKAASRLSTSPQGGGEEAARNPSCAANDHLLFWSAPQASLAEHGVPYAEGLAQFGIDLSAFLIAVTRTQIDALWAAEQALTLPGAFVLCTIAPAKKPLDLIATRRLFLAAKRNKSRCALLRFDIARASAAELRFEISSAPGESALYGLGPPAFDVRLTRNRAGPAGGVLRLQWSAHEHAFRTIPRPLDGAVLPVPADRPPAASRARAL